MARERREADDEVDRDLPPALAGRAELSAAGDTWGGTMAGALTVELALPDRALCGNGPPPASRGGKIARSHLVKAERMAAGTAASNALPKAWLGSSRRDIWPWVPHFPAGVRVRVDVLVRRDPTWSARRLDDDNLIRGLKAAMDGLTDARVWADDRQVRYGTITWETAEPLRGGVILTLSEG